LRFLLAPAAGTIDYRLREKQEKINSSTRFATAGGSGKAPGEGPFSIGT
jgi:hypothetical protein